MFGQDLIPYQREVKDGKRFYRIEKDPSCLHTLLTEPWRGYQEPFRMAPHVYSVSGNIDWSDYLIDTGEGLILIDTSMNPLLYLLIDSIHRVGFDPRDIRWIFISHAHIDHDGGARQIREMSGAEIYFPPSDVEYKKTHAGGMKDQPWQPPYTVDHLYDFSKPMTMGRITMHFRECPGHTPGVTSFFFEDTDETTGKTYKVAMHGGAGVSGKPGDANNDLRKIFIRDCHELAELPIDIVLPSHPNQNNGLAWVPEDKMDYTPWIDQNAWRDLMLERAAAAEKITIMD